MRQGLRFHVEPRMPLRRRCQDLVRPGIDIATPRRPECFYKRAGNPRPVQLLLGQAKLVGTVRYRGIEV